VRRTKRESERTRQGILAAARKVFARQGVTRTTFEEIAAAAGVTRGAIYWHFADKTEIFFAMREQVAVPMIDLIDLALLRADGRDPLAGWSAFCAAFWKRSKTTRRRARRSRSWASNANTSASSSASCCCSARVVPSSSPSSRRPTSGHYVPDGCGPDCARRWQRLKRAAS